ncbi:putative RNA-directed DNA polymerase from transposon BS [Araneus ventricosus]|uniref:Putative RNA-directed DNA polymerase from transposon BS n=1 Tax=Araneus ventricosus TaxID=182803 RepID=A0A4Y2J039_ARAVE|nr:putative RNA-directed DNA polymerase from transposon BS [Araneus ventricosus]
MKKASRSYWDSICNISRNPRMFYSMLNKISNHVSQDINTSNLLIHNNRIISNPQLRPRWPSEAHQQKDFFIGINLDIQSAYDSVYIDGLIQKCLHIGITGYIVKFIHHFLQDRVLQVRWRNQLSKTKVTQRGLAQGSVLSPILFAIFLFDFEDTLEEGVQVSIFTDDIFIYCSHKSPDHIVKKLRRTMNNVYQWCKYWKLKISPEKSAVADLSRRRMSSHPDISYAGVPLPWKTEIKYLGFIFSKTTQNNINIKCLRTKARRKINALKSIAYKTYGPRTKDLISIANKSICSLFFTIVQQLISGRPHISTSVT